MVEIMTRDIAGSELKEVVNKLYVFIRERSSDVHSYFSFSIPNSIGSEIEKACRGIYPLQNVNVRKVKVLKKPKFDGKTLFGVRNRCRHDCLLLLVTRLMEMHGESYSSVTVDEKGQRVERVDGYEPPVQSSV